MANLEFTLFNFGSYPNIPHTDDLPQGSIFIDLPNHYYEPSRGQWFLDSYLDTLVFGEKLGYDAIATTTQLNGPNGLTPTSMLPAAWLAARTERIPIVCLGPILNFYGNPMRAAEEIAVLDNLTQGRLILGLPMGHGMNWHANATANPTAARDRHWEAHDLIVKAFTEPGPFEWRGEHFHVPYANLWPRPVQNPFPPVWIPAAGSKVTFERCAKHHYTYQALFSPRKALIRNVNAFREACRAEGYEAEPNQIAAVVFIHVAETDKQARMEAEPHLLWCMQHAVRSPLHDTFPPGHFSVSSLRGFMTAGGYRDREVGAMSFEELTQEGWAIVGSPETVREQLEELSSDLGAGRVVHIADMASMPNWMVRKSTTLMAEQVIPHFRGPGGKPVWAIEDLRPVPTHAQFGAATLDTDPRAVPLALMPDGNRLDIRDAHVADRRR